MNYKTVFLGTALGLTTLYLAGCSKPEIAVVLEDYCQFHKDCGYATVTQFKHSLSACKNFHMDLLDQTSKGHPSGCKSEVEDFFIDFMNAQMDAGCRADLMQSLNASTQTQEQLVDMLECVQGDGDSSDDVAEMGLQIIEQLELDVNHMSPDVCHIIIGTVMPEQNERVDTVCSIELSNVSTDKCNQLFELLEITNQFSFASVEYRQRICGLFKNPDPA